MEQVMNVYHLFWRQLIVCETPSITTFFPPLFEYKRVARLQLSFINCLFFPSSTCMLLCPPTFTFSRSYLIRSLFPFISFSAPSHILLLRANNYLIWIWTNVGLPVTTQIWCVWLWKRCEEQKLYNQDVSTTEHRNGPLCVANTQQ